MSQRAHLTSDSQLLRMPTTLTRNRVDIHLLLSADQLILSFCSSGAESNVSTARVVYTFILRGARERDQKHRSEAARVLDRDRGTRSPRPVLLCGSVSRLFRGDSFFTARRTAVMDVPRPYPQRARSNSRECLLFSPLPPESGGKQARDVAQDTFV